MSKNKSKGTPITYEDVTKIMESFFIVGSMVLVVILFIIVPFAMGKIDYIRGVGGAFITLYFLWALVQLLNRDRENG